jgi:hypothetical protein
MLVKGNWPLSICLGLGFNPTNEILILKIGCTGEAPYDHSLLRQVSSLVRRLPAIDSSRFQDDLVMEYNDTLLMTYLATITKCSRYFVS